MRMKLRSISILLICMAGLDACSDDQVSSVNQSPPESTPQFTQVVAFGDSLSDAGTFNPTTADSDTSNDSETGLIFSTKPGGTWAVYVAANLGMQLGPNQQVNFGVVGSGGSVEELGGLDYAEGGAKIDVDPADGGVTMENIPGLGTVPVQSATSRSIATQITDYLDEHGQAFNDQQLVLIQGGANDFFAYLTDVAADPSLAANASTVISDAVTAMLTQIARLQAAGATNIVYSNLPDLGITPQFRDTALAGLATSLSTNYNAAVESTLSGWGVAIFDVEALIQAVVASPETYGFTDATTPACNSYTTPGDASTLSALICSPSTLVSENADMTHVFADGVHPTSRAHALWADEVTEQLSSQE